MVSEDRIQDIFEKKEVLPEGVELGPLTCAICGKRLTDPESLHPPLPISLPVETGEFMQNYDSVDVPEDATGLKMRFCEEDWMALNEVTGNPEEVHLEVFDLEHIKFTTPSERQKLIGNSASNRWNQNRLRVARGRVLERGAMDEYMDEAQRRQERVEATLLVAAVDHYGLEYGPVEQAKKKLIRELRNLGYEANLLPDPMIDIEIELSESNQRIVGTVFLAENFHLEEGPISKFDANPERIVGDATYYRMSDEFSQYAGKHHSDAQYLSFYRLQSYDSWIWYPFSEDHNPRVNNDRRYLPIEGPTEHEPHLTLKEIDEQTITAEGFEERMDEIWGEINDERSRVSKARDELRRKFM